MKRFFKNAAYDPAPNGFVVKLDGRTIKTPKRNELVLAHEQLAGLIAQEWDAQETSIDNALMPITRMATSVIDLMPERRFDAEAEILPYFRTDLLCFRAESPASLVKRQRELWDPWLTWANSQFNLAMTATTNVTTSSTPEPKQVLTIKEYLGSLSDWQLVGLHSIVRTSGSLILGLAQCERVIVADALFAAACLDEIFQSEAWGYEADLDKRLQSAKREIVGTDTWFAALGNNNVN